MFGSFALHNATILVTALGECVGGGGRTLCRLQPSAPHRATFANYTPVIDMSYALNAPETVCFYFYCIKHVRRYGTTFYVFHLDCFWIEFHFVSSSSIQGGIGWLFLRFHISLYQFVLNLLFRIFSNLIRPIFICSVDEILCILYYEYIKI